MSKRPRRLTRREQYIKRVEEIEKELSQQVKEATLTLKEKADLYNEDLLLHMNKNQRDIKQFANAIRSDYLTNDQKYRVLVKLKELLIQQREEYRKMFSLHKIYLDKL